MTTKVTVETHDWPVAVTTLDSYADTAGSSTLVVEPNSKMDFVVFDTRALYFKELAHVSK